MHIYDFYFQPGIMVDKKILMFLAEQLLPNTFREHSARVNVFLDGFNLFLCGTGNSHIPSFFPVIKRGIVPICTE